MLSTQNSPIRNQACRFFNQPNGCRNGSNCAFKHTRSQFQQTPGLFSGTSQTLDTPRAPPGICKFYWSKGLCAKGFTCTFKHGVTCDNSGDSSSSNTEGDSQMEEDRSFLSPGLFDPAGFDSGALWDVGAGSLDVQQTQDQLRLFLSEDFQFRSSRQFYAFSKLLLNATSSNGSWTELDGQLFLEAMASKTGLLRLASIIQYENVAVDARSDSRSISFRDGYLPVFQYLSSKCVTKTILHHHVNALYSLLDENIDHIIKNLTLCMECLIDMGSFGNDENSSGVTVFSPLINVFFEYITRFKNVLTLHKGICDFLEKMKDWVQIWLDDLSSPSPRFDDPLLSFPEDKRQFLTGQVNERIHLVMRIVRREREGLERSATRKRNENASSTALDHDTDKLVRELEAHYVGPGILREEGPRHDNDFFDIRDIGIVPTKDELTCKIPPFLPGNIPGAPHPYPGESMQRLLDIQFRLLREEMLAQFRISIQAVLDDLAAPSFDETQLAGVCKHNGGRYISQGSQDQVMFNVYTNVHSVGVGINSRQGLSLMLQVDSPPGAARSGITAERVSYWHNSSRKRLMQGVLVAIVWSRDGKEHVHLGSVSSRDGEIDSSALHSRHTIQLSIVLLNESTIRQTIDSLRLATQDRDGMILVESSVLFEAFRPFLESLQRVPETFPFYNHLPHSISGPRAYDQLRPPFYSLIPGFSFDLSSLLSEEGERNELNLVTSDPDSISNVRTELAKNSSLDPSQAEALVDAITREISLIQGPPGTGKTFMGIELLRVLLENNVGPVLLIAFTNHALDHMLSSIIKSEITTKVVRLGGHSADETVRNYSIDLQTVHDQSSRKAYRELKEHEAIIERTLDNIGAYTRSVHEIVRFLEKSYPEHADFLLEAPAWINDLIRRDFVIEGDVFTWKRARVNRHNTRGFADGTLYEFWKESRDLDFIRMYEAYRELRQSVSADAYRFNGTLASEAYKSDGSRGVELTIFDKSTVQTVESKPCAIEGSEWRQTSDRMDPTLKLSETEVMVEIEAFLLLHGMTEIPREPLSDRPLGSLLYSDSCDVWNYSAIERVRLDELWRSEYVEFTECQDSLDYLYSWGWSSKKHLLYMLHEQRELRSRLGQYEDWNKLRVMQRCDLIGCTTTGAAGSISLLESLCPRVVLVEEAGQVLESHVLASLTDSVQHLILIGDPLQLRPSLNNYELSTENPRSGKFFRFDMSLMERLASTDFPMSRLNIQRRMRPNISSLIRNTLYPDLVDHEITTSYPHVQGMVKDIFFYSHENPESGSSDESISKYNSYEAMMIKDIVKHLLRQGCYSAEGSIVVLCAYIGQLANVRDELAEEMSVIIDDRDQGALADYERPTTRNNHALIKRVQMSQKVRLRTIDNYQGEEADVVLLSLVRNSGKSNKDIDEGVGRPQTRPKIGFLKSENRTNVALSRARHGLYILGNASDFSAQCNIWSSVISQLEADNAVGDAIPIKCNRHPDYIKYISKPGELPDISPDGGCLQDCTERLACGHSCPYKCHSDDESHRFVFCAKPCQRLCPKGHPCQKPCGEPCKNCRHPYRDILLPCGHICKSVPCYQMNDLSEVICTVNVEHELPTCKHKVELSCYVHAEEYKCEAPCDVVLPCCGRACEAKCHTCQRRTKDSHGLQSTLKLQHPWHKCRR